MFKHKRVDEYDEYDKEDELCDKCNWDRCTCLDGEVENND